MPAVDVARELLDQPEYRVEGPLKVTGAARYTADVRLPGRLWMAYTRSPMPHARGGVRGAAAGHPRQRARSGRTDPPPRSRELHVPGAEAAADIPPQRTR